MEDKKWNDETPLEQAMSFNFGLDMDEKDIIRRGTTEVRPKDIPTSSQSTTRR